MQDPKMYILTADALSYKVEKGKHKIYAKKGEKVTEISDCDNVMIVQGPDGDKFPVETKILKQVNKTNPSTAQ